MKISNYTVSVVTQTSHYVSRPKILHIEANYTFAGGGGVGTTAMRVV
jgi:hypothetical protein